MILQREDIEPIVQQWMLDNGIFETDSRFIIIYRICKLLFKPTPEIVNILLKTIEELEKKNVT